MIKIIIENIGTEQRVEYKFTSQSGTSLVRAVLNCVRIFQPEGIDVSLRRYLNSEYEEK